MTFTEHDELANHFTNKLVVGVSIKYCKASEVLIDIQSVL